MEIGGVRLKKGDKIMAMLAAANMDPNAKDDPEKLDLHRHPNRHLALGTGIHFCLGYQLARIEGHSKPCSGAGPNLSWRLSLQTLGGGNGLVSGPSRSYRLSHALNDRFWH